MKEKQYFLEIIRDHLHQRVSRNDEDVNWELIYEYSHSHQLTAIVYFQCKEFIPGHLLNSFKTEAFNTVCINVRRRKMVEEIRSLLKDYSITGFPIKGATISNYYPNWQYRTMGDTDIVVDDLEKTHEILIENGYVNISKERNAEYRYKMQNMEFEFHNRLVYKEPFNIDETTEFLNDYKGYVSNQKLDDSFHFIFVIYHLMKHFTHKGVGFRQFIDVAVLVKNCTELKWDWIKEQLEKINLLSFAETVFFYINRWFGIDTPISYKNLSENLSQGIIESSTNYIFANGVFGFDNEDNRQFYASNVARKSRYPRLSMMRLALKKVFLDYETMSASEYYSFLRGKPILLPVAWIYRIGRVITNNKLNEGRGRIRKSFVSKKYINRREEMFHNWGIQ